MNTAEILKQYLKQKDFNRISPVNGYECFERDQMKVSIDFDTLEYVLSHPEKEPRSGVETNVFFLIVEIDKYRLL